MPVIDSPVHEKVRIGSDWRYGCHNKPRPVKGLTRYDAPYKTVEVGKGWELVFMSVPYLFSEECRFDMSLSDAACEGCQWRGSGEAYDAEVRRNGK